MRDMQSMREFYARHDGPDADPVYLAIPHILRRCAESAEFRYHMLGTETLARLLLAWDKVRKEGDFTAEQALDGIWDAELPRARCSEGEALRAVAEAARAYVDSYIEDTTDDFEALEEALAALDGEDGER